MALDPSGHPSTHAAAGLLLRTGADITIRPLTSLDELKACVTLQKEVWGADFDDAIPVTILQVVSHIGGLLAGAFTADGELAGFVFGFIGTRDGQTVHWSHALGVRESARNAGVGRMLKEYQRVELARRGIATLYWTFDPLMAKNAHFNLNRLGARVVEYVENMYGTTGSPLHHGLATDRLVVSWPTAPRAPRRHESGAGPGLESSQPVLTPKPRPGDILGSIENFARAAIIWIEIPSDIEQESPAAVATWHAATRAHFQWALANGYVVDLLHRDPLTSRSFYVLERSGEEAA